MSSPCSQRELSATRVRVASNMPCGFPREIEDHAEKDCIPCHSQRQTSAKFFIQFLIPIPNSKSPIPNFTFTYGTANSLHLRPRRSRTALRNGRRGHPNRLARLPLDACAIRAQLCARQVECAANPHAPRANRACARQSCADGAFDAQLRGPGV